MKSFKTLIVFSIVLFIAIPAFACRFWVATGDNVAGEVVDQLIDQPQSLKQLGQEYQDGWSVGYFGSDEIMIWRGAKPSITDQKFNDAVFKTSLQPSSLVFAHLRRASSGCVDGVPNPHPFRMSKNGKTWLFGHNGGMDKTILMDLIGEEYLDTNAPAICTYDPPNSWIDSELYFIYLMKVIEEHQWNIEEGMQHGLSALYQMIPEEKRYLNFFLTDGQSVWAFRKGTSLFYQYDPQGQRSYVSSTIPQAEQGDWREFPENTLAVLNPQADIKFITLDN